MDQVSKKDGITNSTWEELTEEEKRVLEGYNHSFYTNWVLSRPCRILLPRSYIEHSENIRRFEFRPQDVVLLSYPRTGTTWLSEMLWGMAWNNELDRAEEEGTLERIIFLYNDMFRTVTDENSPIAKKYFSKFPGKTLEESVWLNLATVAPDRRIIRSHMPAPLLHPDLLNTAKVVCLVRNPKDACVSSFHFRKNLEDFWSFKGDFSEFCEFYFQSGILPFGSYWDNLRRMWALRGHSNVHFVFYEDLSKNLLPELEKLNQFCGFHLSMDQLKKVAEFASMPNMRRRENKHPIFESMKPTSFFRKGKVGGWSSQSTPELESRVDKWIAEGCQGLDIKFAYN